MRKQFGNHVIDVVSVAPRRCYLFNRQGRAVKLEGLGMVTPSINLEGTLKVSHRADRALKNVLNAQGAFRGEIINRANIGKTGDDLAAMWDADNLDNVVS